MTRELAEFLVEACEQAGNDAELYEGYSGRGMMGRETFGVVAESECVLLSSVLQYFKENIEETTFMDGGEQKVQEYTGKAIPEITSFRTDSMGRSRVIFY